jgi:hypothetical protein
MIRFTDDWVVPRLAFLGTLSAELGPQGLRQFEFVGMLSRTLI